jgi:ATP-dependent helicase/nuclease subunit B
MEKLSRGRISPLPLSRGMTEALYGRHLTMSASRLEQFNACPFRHFLKYGLGAEPRREAKENAADLGSLFHAILEAFLRRCLDDKISLKTLGDDQASVLFDEVVPAVLATHNEGLFLHNDRLRATLFLILEIARQAVFALLAQTRAGSFLPIGTELRFGDGGNFPAIVLELSDGRTVRLSGIVDRLDRAEAEGETLLRVVDYKTGGRKLDFGKIAEGLTLQLPLYLSAVCAAGETPAGMYYMPIKVALPKDGEDAAAVLQKQFRLAGLTLSDPVVKECTETALTEKSSKILHGVKNAGESYSGAVCQKQDMQYLMEKARRIAAETSETMLAGEIGVSPSENACTWCDFRSVCRYDTKLASCRARKIPRIAQEAFFETGRKERRGADRGEGADHGNALD